jgi:mandelate racemase
MNHANCSPSSQLILQNIATRAVRVPMNFALGTSAAVVKSAPLLLVDAVTDQGIVGRSYVFCYATSGAKAIAAHIAEAAGWLAGRPCHPAAASRTLLRRFALLGVGGPVRMAMWFNPGSVPLYHSTLH